jgi:hypothetical protein
VVAVLLDFHESWNMTVSTADFKLSTLLCLIGLRLAAETRLLLIPSHTEA